MDVPNANGEIDSYYSNVDIKSAMVPSYAVNSNTSITAGQTIYSTFTGTSLPANQTIRLQLATTQDH